MIASFDKSFDVVSSFLIQFLPADSETSEISEHEIHLLNDTLKICHIFGKKSAKEGNVNCTELAVPDLGDEKVNQQCAAKFAEGCMEVKFDRACYQGTISFLRYGKCNQLNDDDFSKEAFELCCGMCAKQREYYLKWKICRKNTDTLCCCFPGVGGCKNVASIESK